MTATITAPGMWLVATPDGSGVVNYPKTGTVPNADGAVYLGRTQTEVVANMTAAIADLRGTPAFDDVVGLADASTPTLIAQMYQQALANGSSILKNVPGEANPTNDLYIAATVGAGAFGLVATDIGAAATGALGIGGVGAAETGVGAAEAGAGAAEAGAGAGLAGSTIAGIAGLGATLAAISQAFGDLTSPSTWLRVLEFVGGLLLAWVAFKQLTAIAGAS